MTSPREIVLCQYHYDPLDRLISHVLPDIPERQRFYCKSRLVTEMQGAMRYSIVQQGDQLLAQQRREGDSRDTTLLATDQRRSVLKALKGDHAPLPIAFSPYGYRPVESALLSLLGFNGERSDALTGCYLLGNGYRAFNPVLMRFNSPDSFSPFERGGLNSYAYCSGDPVNGRDPSGHAVIFGVFDFADSLFAIPRTRTTTPRTITPTPKARQVVSAEPTSALGAFKRFQNIPHVNEKIIAALPGKDMASLASTSKAMNKTVYSSAKPLSELFGGQTNWPASVRGHTEGILPSQVFPVVRDHYAAMRELRSRTDPMAVIMRRLASMNVRSGTADRWDRLRIREKPLPGQRDPWRELDEFEDSDFSDG